MSWSFLARRLAAVAFALAASAAGEGARAETARLRIASEGARPPYNQLDAKGELAGFEIDLARALCSRAARVCDVVQQDWDQLLAGLESGAHDAVIAALTPTPERRARAAFGAPYLRMPLAFAAPRGRKPRSLEPDALADRAIGVEADAAHRAALEGFYPKAQFRAYAALEDAMLDLAEGRVDFVVGAKDAVAAFLETRRESRCCRLVGDAPHEAWRDQPGFAMAFRPADAALREAFDRALVEMRRDGTFDSISRRYFAWPVE
jgi:polar amino acid transport system substrate-binding protein